MCQSVEKRTKVVILFQIKLTPTVDKNFSKFYEVSTVHMYDKI